ncbi:MAG: DUF370 domain-containing protein [Oscillospiraceae bacterium]|nr:DUF370 domain-containing protein [Oscillospiraceae bacterium]
MYIHLGSDTVVRDSDIIGIFDIENTSVSRITKDYLAASGKRKSAVSVSYEMPKAFIIATVDGRERVYISNVSSATIMKRCK